LSKWQNQNKQQTPSKTRKSYSQQAQAEYNSYQNHRLVHPAKSSLTSTQSNQLGVEGLGSNDDGLELKPGVFGIGALAIGKLKIKTETEMIKRATNEPQGLFDYSIAYTLLLKTQS
jgi:hypothetical protein